ncbi:MAG: DUF4252 domain-containing protein [Flavobacterium sp.]
MKAVVSWAIFLCLLLTSCATEPSLQQYFVENTENKNFIALDISSSILNVDQAKLTEAQKKALQSFEKMNVIAFKRNAGNTHEFETERATLNQILKSPKYQQLMKLGVGKEGVSVSFVGTDEHIEEFVLFANQKEKGFAVARILGKDMNPTHIMNLISVLQQSKIDMDQLKPFQELLKK